MLNIVIFGGPGSGKGTQSEIITEKYQLTHLSTGDLLRAEMAKGSELGKIAKSYTDGGNLVPDEMIVKILAAAIDSQKNDKGYIFDGFPRNVAQASILEEMLAERGYKLGMLLNLVVPDNVLVERMLFRAKTSGRSDDNPETIKRRVQVYHEQTAPVIDYFKAKDLYIGIDGTRSIEEAAADIAGKIDAFLAENK